jgi:hypothetical protein
MKPKLTERDLQDRPEKQSDEGRSERPPSLKLRGTVLRSSKSEGGRKFVG